MSVDSKQFNRAIPSHEEVEQHILQAKRLRSEALAQGAQRLAVTLGAGARRLGAVIGGARTARRNRVRALHASSGRRRHRRPGRRAVGNDRGRLGAAPDHVARKH